jgi:magnesium chelatase family protein
MAVKNLAMVYSAELDGISAKLIEVEIDINVGIHAFTIIGLADKALNEAKDRVNSALKNSGMKPPNRENRKITINLAPADVKKAGSQYDLAIALGYLVATQQIKKFNTQDKIFLGELALDGRLRPVFGALNVAQLAVDKKIKYLFLPARNAHEVSTIKNIQVVPIETLSEAIGILEETASAKQIIPREHLSSISHSPNFSEIKGQENAKRALTIAASGGHNILMVGPPGVGKSFMANALAGILPSLTTQEAIEVTKIWGAAGVSTPGLIQSRPFRAPHQTVSASALLGGGVDPRPGEISLAHRGVLFLDELPEFQRNVLDGLRQPLESGFIRISRAKGSILFPARFILVAAMNPCPCGYYGDVEKQCSCTAYEVIKYQKRISGPLMDRIDLQIKVGRLKIEELRTDSIEDVEQRGSANIKNLVEIVRRIQKDRFRDNPSKTNAEMSSGETQAAAELQPEAEDFLKILGKSHLSPRSYYRLLKVARTIADLEKESFVNSTHLAEAFSYRLKID